MRKLSLRILGVSLLALLLLAVFSQVVAPPASARADSACDDCYAACDAERDAGYWSCQGGYRYCSSDCDAFEDPLRLGDYFTCMTACQDERDRCEDAVQVDERQCSANCRASNGPCS